MIPSIPWLMTQEAIASMSDAAAMTRRQPFGRVRDEAPTYRIVQGLAVVALGGILMRYSGPLARALGWANYRDVAQCVREAFERRDVAGVVLDCDSPGGESMGAKDCAESLRELAASAAKPTGSFVSGKCQGAALQLAAAFGPITSSPSATLGGVGAAWSIVDTSKAHRRKGIKVHVLRSSPLKAAGADGEPLTDARRASLQRYVDAIGAEMEADLARYRGMEAAAVRERFGRGAILTPGDALAAGMIDRIASWEDFTASIALGPKD